MINAALQPYLCYGQSRCQHFFRGEESKRRAEVTIVDEGKNVDIIPGLIKIDKSRSSILLISIHATFTRTCYPRYRWLRTPGMK